MVRAEFADCTARPDLAAARSTIPGYFSGRDRKMVPEAKPAAKQAREVSCDIALCPYLVLQVREAHPQGEQPTVVRDVGGI